MFNKLVLSLVGLLCLATISFAQMPCSTDEHYWKLVQKYPQLEAYQEQFDAQIDAVRNARNTQKLTSATDNTIYDIPLVVHVIHDYGIEDISDNDLYTAAAYWAVVYMKQNADTAGVITPFIPYIGNPNIRLHLATIDPNGNPTKGITRFQSYLTNNAGDEAKYGQWPQNEYVNIWLIGAFGAEDAGAAAYAYFPSSAVYQPFYDGVISLYSYTDPSTKTIPHELGHVLNLYHPWGNTNNAGVACGGTDHVDDTPPTKGHLPTGCTLGAIYDTACATGYMVTYKDIHGADSVVNYPDTTNAQNIMDYTYCQEMFTKGQVVRMRTALLSSVAGRNNLFTPANLAATGALAPMPDLPPVADYIMNREQGGSGIVTDARGYFMSFNNTHSFQFRNASWNDTVSDVLWTFSNGATTPASTSMTTVNNQFSVPGWVTVSLVANSNAGSDTLVNTNAVYAADTTPAGADGYWQAFASPADVSNWPAFNYYNNQFKWEFYTGAGYGDNSCMRYRSFDTSARITGTATGDHDDLFTPAFDLTGSGSNEYVDFYTSGAYTASGYGSGATMKDDSMEVDASTTGGTIWAKLATYYGADLANNGNYGVDFIPSSYNQWVARTVNIPAAYRTRNTYLRFRYFPGNAGNNLYLDNFYVYPYPAGVKEALSTAVNSFNVFPNPSTNGCTLVFKSGNDGKVSYSVKDLAGKLVYEHSNIVAPNSILQEFVPRSVTPSAGMYFITITIDGMNTTRKLVVY